MEEKEKDRDMIAMGATKPWDSPWAKYPVHRNRSTGGENMGGAHNEPSQRKLHYMREIAKILRSRYSSSGKEIKSLTGIDSDWVRMIIDSLCLFLPIWEEPEETSNTTWYGIDHEIAPKVTPFERGETDDYI